MKKLSVLIFSVASLLASGQSSNTQSPASSVIRKIAFDVTHRGPSIWKDHVPEDEIFILDSPNAKPRRLVEGLRPVWSPNGEKVAFCTRRNGYIGQLETIRADGLGRQQLTNLSGGACPTDWSPKGDRLLVTVCREGTQDNCAAGAPIVFVMDSNGKNMTQLVQGYGARWSPDESQIVFGRDPKGIAGPGQVWIADADGKNEKQVIEDRFSLTGVSWFPDGKSIAFASDRGHKHTAIFRISSDGSDLRPIASDKHFSLFFPVVSPDGNYLVVDGIKAPDDRVLLIDLRTRRSTTLAHGLHPSVLWEKH